jgi:hypothetical protein
MLNKDYKQLTEAYQRVLLKEQQEPLTQQQLNAIYNKAQQYQYIKNTPVALATIQELNKNLGEEKTKQILQAAGSVDKTSYDDAWKNKGFVVFQYNTKDNTPDIYIADPSVVSQKYEHFEGALPTDEKTINKTPSLLALKHFGIETSKVPFYVKKVPVAMIKADDVNLGGKNIQTNWGAQTVQNGGFLVREDSGHVYTVAPDHTGNPIGYVPYK